MIQFRHSTGATSQEILQKLTEVSAKNVIVLKMTHKTLELSLTTLKPKEIKALKEQDFKIVKIGKKEKLCYQIR